MNNQIKYLVIILMSCFFASPIAAQKPLKENWDAQKIKGARHLPYPSYSGFPFLTDTWLPGKIEFSDGEIADSLFLRYSSYKDELVYFNQTNSAQILIDKASLKGFSFVDQNGINRMFRKQYFDGFIKGDRYFEVLADGETDLLAYRNVELTSTSPYKDESGTLKNMIYTNEYQFYFYSPENGYTLVRLNNNALLSKFKESDQKPIKKILRKSKVRVTGEESLVLAWKIIEKEGFKINF